MRLVFVLAVASLPVAAPLAVASPPVVAPLAVASPPVAAPLAVASPPVAAPPATAAVGWARPVPGEVASSFSYDPSAPFRAGARRGLRLAARRGEPVHAACSGAVEFSGRLPAGGWAVTLRCGPWRVTHLDLGVVTVSGRVRAGQPVGRAAGPSVRLGVRWQDDPWGYVDPAGFLPPRARVPEAPAGPRVRRTPPAGWDARPAEVRPRRPVAPAVPWTVWAGSGVLALAVLPVALRRGGEALGARAGRAAEVPPSAARAAGSP